MSKAIKLKIEPSFNFTLIGLVTSEPIYRTSWLINEALEIQLKETPPHQTYHNKLQVVQEFSIFRFYTDNECTMHLIQNKSPHGFLIEEHKQVDFWLKIENSSTPSASFLQKLKAVKNISLAFEIKPGSLKSKSRLLFSEENN